MKIKGVEELANVVGLYQCWRKCEGYIPRHVELMITSRCNSICAMCNVWKLAKERLKLQKEDFSTHAYINLFNDLLALGTKAVVLSGGELPQRKDLIALITCRQGEVCGVVK